MQARLETIRIEQELAELRKEKATLQDIFDTPSTMKRVIIREIEGSRANVTVQTLAMRTTESNAR